MDQKKYYEELKREIEERKKVEEKLRLANKIFENAWEGITVTDPSGVIQYVNPAFTTITGYSLEEVKEKKPNVLKSNRHDNKFYKKMWAALLTKGQWQGEIWNRRKSGEAYPEWLNITAIKNAQGITTQYAAVFHDITDLKRNQEKMEHQAYHDALTDLPNRQLLYDRLTVALAHAHRNNEKLAAIFINLDDFKKVNDALGHYTGDLLLMNLKGRLLQCCREEDTVARIGGDEFVIILAKATDELAPMGIAGKIIHALSRPFEFLEKELYVGASIGIALYPSDGDDANALLKNAGIAMYRAKELGKNNFQLFTPAMNEKAIKRLELESSLRNAIVNKEIFLHYQPKVDLKTGYMTGMEALVRWRRPGFGFISPAEFIPVAEETGLINGIGEWVIREACAYMQRIQRAGYAALSISVNLSARQFEQEDLVDTIKKILLEADVLPQQLELEVTESAIIRSIDSTIKILKKLRDIGFYLSIDDFGTGYSSLNYLKRFPITTLKIDKSFVDDLSSDSRSRAIAKAIVAMSHDMGIKVIAEGVEFEEQLDFLRTINCDGIQGYIFSRPLPEEEMDKLLKQGKKIKIKPSEERK